MEHSKLTYFPWKGRETIEIFDDEDPDPFGSYIGEIFDRETFKLIEDFKMTIAPTLTNVQAVLGTYTESEIGYTATFTEQGSSAISSITLDGDTLSVVFRGQTETYVYNINSDARDTLYDEIVAVLQEGEGSVGKVVNQLRKDEKIQLI